MISRRNFIGSSALTATAAAAQTAGPARPVGPNSRVTVGMIAVGARAHELLEAIKQCEGTEIVAVCDAYEGRLERAVKRTGGRAKSVSDWREILNDKSIDLVTIASPDHWHKTHVLEALKAGKDVYCEKPLTYTVEDGQEILDAVKQSGRLLPRCTRGRHDRIKEAAHLSRVGLRRRRVQQNTVRWRIKRRRREWQWGGRGGALLQSCCIAAIHAVVRPSSSQSQITFNEKWHGREARATD